MQCLRLNLNSCPVIASPFKAVSYSALLVLERMWELTQTGWQCCNHCLLILGTATLGDVLIIIILVVWILTTLGLLHEGQIARVVVTFCYTNPHVGIFLTITCSFVWTDLLNISIFDVNCSVTKLCSHWKYGKLVCGYVWKNHVVLCSMWVRKSQGD